MFTVQFWAAAGERMIRAAAISATASFTTGATNLAEVPWQATGTAALIGALASLLISLSVGKVTGGDPGVAETTIDHSGRPPQR